MVGLLRGSNGTGVLAIECRGGDTHHPKKGKSSLKKLSGLPQIEEAKKRRSQVLVFRVFPTSLPLPCLAKAREAHCFHQLENARKACVVLSPAFARDLTFFGSHAADPRIHPPISQRKKIKTPVSFSFVFPIGKTYLLE